MSLQDAEYACVIFIATRQNYRAAPVARECVNDEIKIWVNKNVNGVA